MMNAVHARRDKNQVQNPLDPNWQAPVRMMKQCRRLQRHEEDDQHEVEAAIHAVANGVERGQERVAVRGLRFRHQRADRKPHHQEAERAHQRHRDRRPRRW